MKRLLLVAYYYPPRPGVGARRPAQLRKYLPQYGWDVTVLTARLQGNRAPSSSGVVATNYVDVLQSVKRCLHLNGTATHERLGVPLGYETRVRNPLRHRVISLAYQVCTFPDREVGWSPFALRALRDLVRSEHFDAVMTTSPPYVAGVVTALANRGVPWIADIRDLWTGTDIIERDAGIRWLERRLERWTLRRASMITAVSKPMQDYLVREFPRVPVETIYNAFDPDDWADIPFEPNERCTFLYAGSLYQGRQSPQLLFQAVRRLFDRGALRRDDLSIDFYCDDSASVERAARDEGISETVRSLGYVSPSDIQRLERRADRLVCLLWAGVGADTIVTGRLLEYLGARRRVLAIGGGARSAVDDVLAATGAGTRCTTVEPLETEILRAVRAFKARQTDVIAADAVRAFEAPHMAQRFAEVLERVSAREGSFV